MLEFYREDVERHKGTPCYIDGACFEVARLGTKLAQKQIREIKETLYGILPNPKDINEDEILAHWLGNFGVVGWSDVIDAGDKDNLDFSRSNAMRIFLNHEYWLSLNKAFIALALNFENYLHESAYEDVENIKKS